MSNNSVKNIVVKGYLSADFYLDIKAKCEEAKVSMSAGISQALRQWEPAHRIPRNVGVHRPRPGLKRALQLPGHRQSYGGAPVPHPRV